MTIMCIFRGNLFDGKGIILTITLFLADREEDHLFIH